MGKFNEIQEETTQSWGSNSFTTTVKEDTVEFDSAKDKFTFKDAVEVPSLKVNGDTVGAQVQSDWNQSDDTKVDYIKNKPTIDPQVQADWNQSDDTKADYIKNKPSVKASTGDYSVIVCNIEEYEDALDEPVVNEASGDLSFAEGCGSKALELACHAEGYETTASGGEPDSNWYISGASHAEGIGTQASGNFSHAEGSSTEASGSSSHAEGDDTEASGDNSHAEGYGTTASESSSHAEGNGTTASGYASHAEGEDTTASGDYSHAEGRKTIANHEAQHVFGTYNIEDPSSADVYSKGNYVEIVGNGEGLNERSNARTLDWSGNEQIAGTLRIGSTSTGGVLLKEDSGSLKISFDNGTTWLTVSAS